MPEKLRDILRPEHLAWIQRQPELKGLTIEDQAFEWRQIDGPGGKLGSSRYTGSRLFSSERLVVIDVADVPQRQPYPFELDGARALLLGELVHNHDALTFGGRLKVWWQNLWLPYEKRPHEHRAHRIGDELAARWPS